MLAGKAPGNVRQGNVRNGGVEISMNVANVTVSAMSHGLNLGFQ